MKRILLIDHPQFTSATYSLWQGLKELEELYPEHLSMYCYPYIPTNYDDGQFDLRGMSWFNWLDELVENSKRGAAQLPYGIPPFHAEERIISGGGTLVHRGAPWRRFSKGNVLDDEAKVLSEFEKHGFDLVVLGNSHRVPTILLGRLKERISSFPPVVYLDAGERDELNEHWIHVFRPDVVFKQILTPETKARGLSVQIPGYTLRMYPLPLSSPVVDGLNVTFEGLSLQWLRGNSITSAKMLDVFYSMGNTWPAREAVVKALDELVLRRNMSRVRSCSYTHYHFVLAGSRMAVTMRGSGRDTTRYWEIPLYRTVMVADGTMGCIHPYPFEDGKTAFFYRSVDELVRIVEAHLSGSGDIADDEISRISLAGQEHLWRYHSTAARAVFFLDVLKEEIGFTDPDLKSALGLWRATKGWNGRPWEGPVV